MEEIYEKHFHTNIFRIFYVLYLRLLGGFFFDFGNLFMIIIQYIFLDFFLYIAFAYPNDDALEGNT